MYKSKFTSHKQYSFGLLFTKNEKKNYADQGTLQLFFTLSEKKLLAANL